MTTPDAGEAPTGSMTPGSFDAASTFSVLSKPSLEDGYRAGRLAEGGRGSTIFLLAVTGGLGACGLLLMTTSNLADFCIGLVALAIGLIGFVPLLRITIGRTSRSAQARWNVGVGEGTTYTFGPEGITVDSTDVSTTIRWNAVTSIRDDGGLLMFVGKGFQPRSLERSAFSSPGQRLAVIDYARARIAAVLASGVNPTNGGRSVSYAGGWRDLPRSDRVGLIYGVVGIAFGVYLLWASLVIFSAGPASANAGWWVLGISLLFLAGAVLVVVRRLRSARPLVGLGMTWMIGEDGLHTLSSLGQSTIQPWATIGDVSVRGAGLVLQLPLGQKMVVPSRAFGDPEGVFAFKAEIEQHITSSRPPGPLTNS